MSRRRLRDNKSAQIHIIDAITAVAIISITLVVISFVSTGPSVSSPHTSAQLKYSVDDALRNMDVQNVSGEDTSFLEYYLSKYLEDTDTGTVRENFYYNITSNFPPDYNASTFSYVSYNLWVYNSSNGSTSFWATSNPDEGWGGISYAKDSFGKVVRGHRIVFYKGYMYDVILEVWFGK